MRAELATPFALGVDTVVRLDAAACARLRNASMMFVVRYVFGRYAITPDELAVALAAGLRVMLVTPSRAPGWRPTAALGSEDGRRAVDALARLAAPATVTIWIDLEGAAAPAGPYVEACAAALRAARYEAGLYVGAEPGGLDSASLWALRGVTRYWRSGSDVPTPARRGWCMQQLRPLDTTIVGVRVDVDVVERDHLGGLPTWIAS